MGTFSHDRRKYERIVYAINVVVTADSDRFSCTTVNISRGGILIRTDKSLSLGQAISITLQLPDSKKPSVSKGTVVRRAGDCYGIAFSSPLTCLPAD